jgi:hypothetical protein
MTEPLESPASPRVKEAWDAVRRFLSSGPKSGSVISAYLSTTAGFHPKEHGFPTLTAFLQAMGHDLQVVSYAGTDRVWQYQSFARVAPRRNELGAAIWRALASPNSESRVQAFVHSGDGHWELRDVNGKVLLPSEPRTELELQLQTPGEWYRVPPLPAEKHQKLAKAFSRRSDLGALGRALAAVLEVDQWWESWRQLLQNRPDLQQAWTDSREREVKAWLRDHLRKAGLRDSQLEAAAAVAAPPEPQVAEPFGAAPTNQGQGASVTTLRHLAGQVVQHMTEAELEDLRIPLRALLRVIPR